MQCDVYPQETARLFTSYQLYSNGTFASNVMTLLCFFILKLVHFSRLALYILLLVFTIHFTTIHRVLFDST